MSKQSKHSVTESHSVSATRPGNRLFAQKWLSWLGLLAFASIVLSILFLDQTITQSVTTKKHVSFYRVVRELTDLGEGKYYFAGVILVGLTSWVMSFASRGQNRPWSSRVEKLKHWCLYAFTCMLVSGVVLQIFKHLLGRQRPHVSGDVNPHVFDFINTNWHYHSMPSGHTQTLFTFATLLWITFPNLSKWIFLVPAFLAFTRLPLEEHFLSDVIFGAYIGYAIPVLMSVRWGRLAWSTRPRNST